MRGEPFLSDQISSTFSLKILPISGLLHYAIGHMQSSIQAPRIIELQTGSIDTRLEGIDHIECSITAGRYGMRQQKTKRILHLMKKNGRASCRERVCKKV